MNKTKNNFDLLVRNLNKSCFERQIKKSKKYNAFFAENISVLKTEYNMKTIKFQRQEISYEELNKFYNKLKNDDFQLFKKQQHKFKLFIYLEYNKFCMDIDENGVRTKLLKIDMPEKIIGDNNGYTALAFEKCIKNQIKTYLKQKQTNIEIVTKLPNN